jgi:hypothetical protein
MTIGRPFPITGTSDDGLVQLGPCDLLAVVVGTELASGTLALHDCASEGAAAAGNKKLTIKLDTREDFEFGPAGARFDTGLVAIVSGACSVMVVWG